VDQRFAVAEQLRAVGVENARIILEPVPRNTAPAIAVAALLSLQADRAAILLVLPADHLLPDTAAFGAAVSSALGATRDGAFVLFGIEPTRPETGYGYIRVGDPIPRHPAVRHVAAFVEKPALAVAQQYLTAGQYLWNSGIFLLPAAGLVAALERHDPGVINAARAALAGATTDLDFMRLAEPAFAASRSISIDRSVIEKTDRTAVVPVNFSWSDAGTWSALWEVGAKDPDGNVVVGQAIGFSTRNSYLRSEGPVVAAVGVDDLVVVATGDAVLVTVKAADQQVSALVEFLKQKRAPVATVGQRVHRPWGFYQTLHAGERFQVKRITVNPAARLSLQKHQHRSEHWVVVNGTALVTRDGEHIVLNENESVFLPLGCVHRLENRGEQPLTLIEVQSGSYLGEDDIVRLHDDFGRVGAENAQAVEPVTGESEREEPLRRDTDGGD
jgi:mannose-1-phosphate guanylyltransferase/mannose-1-phosphate guanylyltransferase/mannose-6-phosphate isomerase